MSDAEAKAIELISGERQGIVATLIRSILRVVSWGYKLATSVRNCLFDIRVRKAHRVPVRVISIGNITTGGTGKTPFVAYVVDWFVRRGTRSGIVSRGNAIRILDVRNTWTQPVKNSFLVVGDFSIASCHGPVAATHYA